MIKQWQTNHQKKKKRQESEKKADIIRKGGTQAEKGKNAWKKTKTNIRKKANQIPGRRQA